MTTPVTRIKEKTTPKSPKSPKVPRKVRQQRQPLLNRELSWLDFNHRVLEEALDERHPLLERLKFLAIFSSNLDEFFMVRVSGLQEAIEAGILEESPDGLSPAEQLTEIRNRLKPMLDQQMRCLNEQVLPALAEEGVVIRPLRELTKRERKMADEYFLENVFPILTPQAVDPGHPFPYISNLSLNLGVMVSPNPPKKAKDASLSMNARFARIKLPPIVPRLIPIDDKRTRFTFLGSLISANIELLFPNMRTGKCYLFRVTRDADFEIKDDEASDLMRTMQKHVRRMRFGDAARLEVSASMPREMVDFLTTSLELSPDDVYSVDGPFNIPDLMQLYDLDRPDLKDRPLQASTPAPLRESANVFDAIRHQDMLLHHPYTSYNTVTSFIETA